jgi:hypothetical protein
MAHDDLVCPPPVLPFDHPTCRLALCSRFTLSYRDVEDLLAERGLDVGAKYVVLKVFLARPDDLDREVDLLGDHGPPGRRSPSPADDRTPCSISAGNKGAITAAQVETQRKQE